MQCEICGAAASLHVTDVDEHGTTERHFCRVHRNAAGYFVPSDQELAQSLLPEIRGITAFMQTHGRMPSRAEARERQLGAFAGEWQIEPGSDEFYRLLAHLEAVVAFVKTHGRLPSGGEIPGVP